MQSHKRYCDSRTVDYYTIISALETLELNYFSQNLIRWHFISYLFLKSLRKPDVCLQQKKYKIDWLLFITFIYIYEYLHQEVYLLPYSIRVSASC